MLYTPPALDRPSELTITPWTYQGLGVPFTMTAMAAGSQNWIAANVVVFVPFWTPEPIMVTKMFWLNGAAVAGNLDAGVYAESGALLGSTGSTAQAGTNDCQVVNTTDLLLARGRYYMAMVSDTSGVTQKVMAALPTVGIPQAFGLLEQAAVTLPLATNANPATFAKYTRAFIPIVGLLANRSYGP